MTELTPISPSTTAAVPLVRLRYRDVNTFLDAWTKGLGDGSLWVAGVPPLTSHVRVQLQVSDTALQPLKATVVERNTGYGLVVEATSELAAFLGRASALRRQGRRSVASTDSRRADERYETALTVRLGSLPELEAQFVSNISRGGIFVRSASPPPVGTQVVLALELPGGEVVNVDATVMHHTPAGAGLRFRDVSPQAFAPIERLLSHFSKRRPRVLLIHAADSWRDGAVASLRAAGLELEVCNDAQSGFRRLVDALFELDLVIIEVGGRQVDGFAVLERIRSQGGELGLRVMMLLPEPPSIETPGSGNTWIASKLQPLDALVNRVRAQVGLTP